MKFGLAQCLASAAGLGFIISVSAQPGELPAAPAQQREHVAEEPPGRTHIHMRLSLEEAICSAQNHSIAAMVAKYTFLSSYWSFRSYRASRLPSLNLTGEVLSFDRSLRLLQDYDTGQMRYLDNYNLQNTLGLAIQQNISLTGGTLQLYSSLNRLDQFAPKESKSYYSQPITLSYTQPLFAYNRFKWEKKIAPKEYELAKRTYIEAMEDVTVQAVNYYFSLLLSKTKHAIAVKNYGNTKSLYDIAEERLKLGSITHDELLQLQLRMLNDSLAINDTSLAVREQKMRFNSYLRYNESIDIEPVLSDRIPVIEIDYVTVLDKALENSSFNIDNQIRILNADANIAQAKAERGATATVNARFGLSQTGESFRTAYSNLLDQEVIGLQFSIPIFDWGMGKGRVRMARAKAEMVRNQIEQDEADYRHTLYTLIEQFHNQRNQCAVAARAREVAERRYAIALENFRRGTVSVTDMNTAQTEKDEANQTYVSAVADFWNYYYSLRRKTLYDFISHTDISVEFDRLIEE